MTQPHPHARKRKPQFNRDATTTDECDVIPRTVMTIVMLIDYVKVKLQLLHYSKSPTSDRSWIESFRPKYIVRGTNFQQFLDIEWHELWHERVQTSLIELFNKACLKRRQMSTWRMPAWDCPNGSCMTAVGRRHEMWQKPGYCTHNVSNCCCHLLGGRRCYF